MALCPEQCFLRLQRQQFTKRQSIRLGGSFVDGSLGPKPSKSTKREEIISFGVHGVSVSTDLPSFRVPENLRVFQKWKTFSLLLQSDSSQKLLKETAVRSGESKCWIKVTPSSTWEIQPLVAKTAVLGPVMRQEGERWMVGVMFGLGKGKQHRHSLSRSTQLPNSPFTWFDQQYSFLAKGSIVTSLNFLCGPVWWFAFYSHRCTQVTMHLLGHWEERDKGEHLPVCVGLQPSLL